MSGAGHKRVDSWAISGASWVWCLAANPGAIRRETRGGVFMICFPPSIIEPGALQSNLIAKLCTLQPAARANNTTYYLHPLLLLLHLPPLHLALALIAIHTLFSNILFQVPEAYHSADGHVAACCCHAASFAYTAAGATLGSINSYTQHSA